MRRVGASIAFRGDLVPLFLERMEQLLVGHDLLALELDARYTREYTELVGLMLDYATEVMGRDDLEARLSASDVDDELEQSLSHTAGQWEVQQAPYACSAKVFRRLARGEEATFVDDMRSRVLRHCSDRAVPVPLIGWGLETHQAGS